MGRPDSRRITRVPRYSGRPRERSDLNYGTVTPCGQASQPVRISIAFFTHFAQYRSQCGSRYTRHATPVCLHVTRFRLFRFRSPLLTESILFLFLRLMRCFSSPAYPSIAVIRHCPYRVPPFGNPRIKGYVLLTAEYRCLSRPSSALCPKASAIRP